MVGEDGNAEEEEDGSLVRKVKEASLIDLTEDAQRPETSENVVKDEIGGVGVGIGANERGVEYHGGLGLTFKFPGDAKK